MARANPARDVIVEALDLLESYGIDPTPEKVRANIKVDGLTLADATEGLRKYINSQIGPVMKERGLIITDAAAHTRKPFWDSNVDELEAQLQVKKESRRFDENRITADKAVIDFLKEQQETFGYEVYPGLFHAEIDRIYAMHGLVSPGS